MSREQRDRWRLGLVLAAVVAVAAWGLARALPPVAAAGYFVEDLLNGFLAPPEPQHDSIAIVAITDDSLAEHVCLAPIDRDFLADLVTRLRAAGVRAIGLDILLDRPTWPGRMRACAGRCRPPGRPWSPSPPGRPRP